MDTLVKQILESCKRDDVKKQCKALMKPLLEFILYPYIYLMILLLFLIFTMMLCILILLILYRPLREII